MVSQSTQQLLFNTEAATALQWAKFVLCKPSWRRFPALQDASLPFDYQSQTCQAGSILRLQDCTSNNWECLRTKYDLLGYSTATLFMQIHCQESPVIIYNLCRNNKMRKRFHLSHNWWDIINPRFQELQLYTVGLPISLCLLSLYWSFCIPTRCCCCLSLSRLGWLQSSLFFQATPAVSVVEALNCPKGSQKITGMGPDKHQQGGSVNGCRAWVEHIPRWPFRSVLISPLGHKSALSHW